jgi:hypothetical protein
MAEILRILNDEQRPVSPEGDAARIAESARPPGMSLASLLDLSRELRGMLLAVQPRAEFRDELYEHLLIEARQQQALRSLSLPVGPDPALREPQTIVRRIYPGYAPGSRRWLLGAAAVGSAASVVGLLAYVRSRRHGSAA